MVTRQHGRRCSWLQTYWRYGKTPPVPLEGIRYRTDQVLGPRFPVARLRCGRRTLTEVATALALPGLKLVAAFQAGQNDFIGAYRAH